MKTTLSGGGVVVGPQGRVAVVSQNGNSWSLPKGHVDPGETLQQAAERETQEESGLKALQFVKELGKYHRYQIGIDGKENKEEWKEIVIFLFTTSETELDPEDPHNPEARWVPPDDVVALLTHPKDKAFFASVLPTVKQFIATGK